MDGPLTAGAAITLQPGQVLLNKYEVISLLGAGKFGEVYHGFNRNLGHEAALKFVRVADQVSHRAQIEAQAQNLCTHDNAVRINAADVLNEAVVIEMEYIAGGSLGDRLAHEFVPVVDSISYPKHILYALRHAHTRAIIHRDVKPVRLSDEGLGGRGRGQARALRGCRRNPPRFKESDRDRARTLHRRSQERAAERRLRGGRRSTAWQKPSADAAREPPPSVNVPVRFWIS